MYTLMILSYNQNKIIFFHKFPNWKKKELLLSLAINNIESTKG